MRLNVTLGARTDRRARPGGTGQSSIGPVAEFRVQIDVFATAHAWMMAVLTHG
jgi:hypothetical protein